MGRGGVGVVVYEWMVLKSGASVSIAINAIDVVISKQVLKNMIARYKSDLKIKNGHKTKDMYHFWMKLKL